MVCLKKVDVLVIVDATNEILERITLQLGTLQKKNRELTRANFMWKRFERNIRQLFLSLLTSEKLFQSIFRGLR